MCEKEMEALRRKKVTDTTQLTDTQRKSKDDEEKIK
jgi:hypothetical protein